MAVKFEYRFYDFEKNYFKVEIYRPGEADTLYTIQKAGADPVSVSHGGTDKNSLENTIIQGKQLEFSFFLPRADVTNINDIFESQYQDYILKFSNITAGEGSSAVTIFMGYVKPENLTKRYETKPPYIEIIMPANDALVDLGEFDFRDASDNLIVSRDSILEVLKNALSPIAGTVLNFNFKVQLGTYETTLMTATECALKEIYVDTRAFLNGDIHDDDPINCYDVITEVLRPFNCVIRQEGENYVITNYHELDSYEFLYDWSTLTQQSRTATGNILDVSNMDYLPYVEEQKIHPIKKARITHQYDVVSSEFLPTNEWAEWSFQQFTSVTPDVDDPTSTQVYVDYQLANVTPEPYFQLTTPINITKISNTDYLLLSFDYTIDSFTSALNSDAQIFFKIEWQRPNNTWTSPTYHELDLRVRQKMISLTTEKNPDAVVSENGNYNVRVTVYVKRNYYEDMYLTIENPSIQVLPSTSADNLESTGRRGGRSSSGERGTGSGRARRGRSATNVRWGDREGREDTAIEDKVFTLEQADGYEKFENTLIFADAHDSPNRRDNSILVNVFYDAADQLTQAWNSYGNTEGKSIIYIYAKNIITNRQGYKNYIRGTVYDRNHTIKFSNILQIGSRYYFISEYDRHYRDGYVDIALIEILTSPISFITSDIVDENVQNVPANDNPSSPFDLDGIDQDIHTFEVGDVVRYDAVQEKYVKARANSVANAKAVGIVSEVMNTNRFKFLSNEYIPSNSQLYQTLESRYSLEVGEYYFLSPTTDGEMLKSASLNTNDIEQCIGYVTTKGLQVEINARDIKPPGTDPYTPRANLQALTTGNNTVTYSTAFPAGSSVIVWIYTYDSNGYQVGHRIVSEAVTGFTIYVPKDCTLKYIATLAN